MSQSELKRLIEKIDQWNRVEGKNGVSPREAKSRVVQMLSVLEVSCEITDAVYRGTGPGDAAPHIYEAACTDGMGYLLSLAGTSLSGVSCLAGDQGGVQVACALPANADRKASADAVLRGKAVSCGVRDVKWLGVDAGNFDHLQVTCEESDEYVVRTPRPGHGGAIEVLSCQEAIKLGIPCELAPSPTSASGTGADSRPTLSWFKDALIRNGVSCETKRARIVGRESIKRRYLVEFECAGQPQGLVAMVPAAGDTVNSFESMNCQTAAGRGINCQFSAAVQQNAPD